MDGSLLWVYEGLTQYLATSSGAGRPDDPEQARDHLASIAATLDNRPGRAWRPVEDTAAAAQILYESPGRLGEPAPQHRLLRRGHPHLARADTLIRQSTAGAKSLDDFLQDLPRRSDSSPVVKTYTADDVYAALNQVARATGSAFSPSASRRSARARRSAAVEASGWRLAWSEDKGPRTKAREHAESYEITDERFSLGFEARKDGSLVDVPRHAGRPRRFSPRHEALAVDGRRYSREVLETRCGSEGARAAVETWRRTPSSRTYSSLDGGTALPRLVATRRSRLLGDILGARGQRQEERHSGAGPPEIQSSAAAQET